MTAEVVRAWWEAHPASTGSDSSLWISKELLLPV